MPFLNIGMCFIIIPFKFYVIHIYTIFIISIKIKGISLRTESPPMPNDLMEEHKRLFNALFNFTRKLDSHYVCAKMMKILMEARRQRATKLR